MSLFNALLEKHNLTLKENRVYNQTGEFAVLVSPGFGAGWSTWGADVFDPAAVVSVLSSLTCEDYEGLFEELNGIPVEEYTGGYRDLEVIWVKPGTQFRVEEYDGSESLIVNSSDYWLT